MYVVTYCILCSLDSSVKNWKCFISFIVSLFFFCYERSSKLVCMQGIHYALFCFYCRNVIALFDVLLALGSLWAQSEKIQHFLGIRFYSISLSCKNDICNLYLRWMGFYNWRLTLWKLLACHGFIFTSQVFSPSWMMSWDRYTLSHPRLCCCRLRR